MEQINNSEARERAERRVDELRGFYVHLLIYCIVNTGLCLINYFSSPQHLWFFWPLLGWG
ncbi:MAG: 2TM domain-containing protein, partial [Dysgonamonadaceae bacterium]|nr:2TM domain-containing protein [Dysgonamonadaceae bacterium]